MNTLRSAVLLTTLLLAAVLLSPALQAQAPGADAQAAALVQQASTAATAIFTDIGTRMTGTRQSELLGTDSAVMPTLPSIWSRVEGEVMAPLLQAAAMSCAAVEPAQAVAVGVAAKYVHMGVEPPETLDRVMANLNPAGGKCEEDAKAACKAKADPAILVKFWNNPARSAVLTGTMRADDPVYQQVLEKRARHICTPKSYKITGNAGPMTVTGTACNVEEPFFTKGVGGGMVVEFIYNPGDDEARGTMSYTGGVRMAGKGTYTLTLTDQGGTLVHISTGQVARGGAATNTPILTLTRMDPC